MTYDESRIRATVPTFRDKTIGGIDVWVHVVRTYARSRECYKLIAAIGKSRTSEADVEDARDA